MNWRAYDISLPLDAHPQWPGDCAYVRQGRMSLSANDTANVSDLHMSAHSGTHVEAPAHMIAGGAAIDSYGMERFILPCTVVDVGDVACIEAASLDQVPAAPGEAILFKTRNSTRGLIRQREFQTDFTYIGASAGQWCIDHRVGLVGVDYLSVDSCQAPGCPVHVMLLAADILILEAVDLSAVSAGRYTLSCLPLKLVGGEASPVRAVLTPPVG
ncbi:MAG: cyclase family protein [Planctomycetes bacterium]|nr:cyclase family protein [Planctomycetota bacterium]